VPDATQLGTSVEVAVTETVVEVSTTETTAEVTVDEYAVEVTAPGPQGPRGHVRETPTFTYMGELAVYAGLGRWVFASSGTLSSVALSLHVAPVGADVIVDVNINGASVFADPDDRPRVAAGGNSGIANVVGTYVSAGDYMTVDIDQVGSTAPGETLVAIARVTVTE
jgi:hypothetical protein